jgi:hypothetical protein
MVEFFENYFSWSGFGDVFLNNGDEGRERGLMLDVSLKVPFEQSFQAFDSPFLFVIFLTQPYTPKSFPLKTQGQISSHFKTPSTCLANQPEIINS